MASAGKKASWREQLLGFAVLAGIAYGLSSCFSGEVSEASRDRSCKSTVMAFVMSQKFIRNRLKSPSSASFPSITADGVQAISTSDCEFAVRAYVDAQNGFGAQIRTPYSMRLRYNRNTNDWSGWDVRM
jgi:hypothetical protein